MAKKLQADTVLGAVTLLLLGSGLVMVWSASTALSQEAHGHAYHFLLRQSVGAALGVLAMLLALRFDYRVLSRPQVVWSGLAGATLLLVLVLFLPAVNGVHRWIRLGPLSLQPAELCKLAVIVYLAYAIDRRQGRMQEPGAMVAPLLLMGWFAGLIFLQPDLGSAATIVLIGVVLLFVAGVRVRWFAALGVLALPLLWKAINAAAYRQSRIRAFLDPDADPLRAGYQIIQSLIAVGIGGVQGAGLMSGQQKLFYLPYPYSDFIFAVIGEEVGLWGASLLVLGFLIFLWRGLRAAFRAPDAFGTFLAAGLTLAVVLQAFINMSVVLKLLPTKGIPLPFISYGSSSLVVTLFAVGLILNVSQHAD
jgi:cell division protein FtsW